MYCVERDSGPNQWAREMCFRTEFKAFVHARTKSLATGNTYRILFSTPLITGTEITMPQTVITIPQAMRNISVVVLSMRQGWQDEITPAEA